ncbi:MAG: phage holin family protein [Verrucomicrobiota bacterium]|nr:phage holin family protein [Verrucomicrobiota bacterium]
MLKLLQNALIVALGVFLASYLLDGIHYDNKQALLLVVVLLTLFNLFLRPVLILFTLPFVIFTLGLGVWLINSVLFFVAGRAVSGFHVDNFWDAIWGALIVSLTTMIANGFLNKSKTGSTSGRFNFNVRLNRGGMAPGQQPGNATPRKALRKDDDKVIDI